MVKGNYKPKHLKVVQRPTKEFIDQLRLVGASDELIHKVSHAKRQSDRRTKRQRWRQFRREQAEPERLWP